MGSPSFIYRRRLRTDQVCLFGTQCAQATSTPVSLASLRSTCVDHTVLDRTLKHRAINYGYYLHYIDIEKSVQS